MDVRKKLAGLLNEAGDNVFVVANQPVELQKKRIYEEIADCLIAHGVTVQEWISVKDRLPEDGEIVLVCGSRGGVYTAVFNKPGQYRGWHKLNSKSHYCDPTHWMPLPQPPKGE